MRAIQTLNADLQTLDVEYNKLSDCMAQGEGDEYDPKCLTSTLVVTAVSQRWQTLTCLMGLSFIKFYEMDTLWLFFWIQAWNSKTLEHRHLRWAKQSEAIMKASTFVCLGRFFNIHWVKYLTCISVIFLPQCIPVGARRLPQMKPRFGWGLESSHQ